MSDLLNFAVALLIMLPLGGLCAWMSYRLGQRLKVTDEGTASRLGIALFPLPFYLVFFILLRLLHLPHDAVYACPGIFIGGLMGTRAARLRNMEQGSTRNPAEGEIDQWLDLVNQSVAAPSGYVSDLIFWPNLHGCTNEPSR